MHYTDRTCYEVIEVSPDGKTVKLEYLEPKHDPSKEGGMGHQNWIFTPTKIYKTVVWKNNSWKIKSKAIEFTKEFIEKTDGDSYSKYLTKEQHQAVYGGNPYPRFVVDGITQSKFNYTKINIIFGVKDYYYDWSF